MPSGNGGYLSLVPLVHNYAAAGSLKFTTVYVMGMKSRPSKVTVGFTPVPANQIAFNGNNVSRLIPLSSSPMNSDGRCR